MNKKKLLVILLIFILCLFTSAKWRYKINDDLINNIIERLNHLVSDYPQEKVYLHINKPAFIAGDDLWFKAYIVDATYHDFSLMSNNLYVELINSQGKIISHKLYWIERGVANGDFNLKDSLPSGIYQIRAYTNWMRNFGEDHFFRVNLRILNLKSGNNNKQDISSNSSKEIDLQFFPEGGTLVNDIYCRIAFKGIDQNGRGIDIYGTILDNSGKAVGQLKSTHLGMGSFYLKPENGKTYHAEIITDGQIKSFNLPLAANRGVVISVENTSKGIISFKLYDTDSLKRDVSDEYTLFGVLRGKVCFWKKLEKGQHSLNIPNRIVETGILQLTLFDNAMLPVCERLIFVNHHRDGNVIISGNKQKYGVREKVELDLHVLDHKGHPLIGNLSVSVFSNDFNSFKNTDADNILTNLLITSDLKGNIQNPSYYFSSDSAAVRNALDLLMMTQGWSRFVWKDVLANKTPEINFQPEHGINVEGSVRRLLINKPAPDSKITLLLFDKNNQVFNALYSHKVKDKKGLLYLPLDGRNKLFETHSDSVGKFIFDNLYFTDSSKLIIQAVNQKGKANTIINVNDIGTNSTLRILPPKQIINSETLPHLHAFEESIEELKWLWLKKGDILLKEVTVTGYSKNNDTRLRLYGIPDYEYNVGNEPATYSSVFEMLQTRIPGILISSGSTGETVTIRRRGKQGMPLFLVDGMVTDGEFVNMIAPSSIDKIELVLDPTGTSMYGTNTTTGARAANGVISIFTKNGTILNDHNLKFNIAYRSPVGYSLSQEFYSPKYDVALNNEIQDIRSALYWNPYVFTDSTGNGKVVFYTNDVGSEYHVSVEGITRDGVICKGNSSISVVK